MGLDIYIAASGCTAQQKSLEVIANNLANINTPGFKRDIPAFSLWLYKAANSSSAGSARFFDLPVILDRTTTDFSQGTIRETGNPLDLAIEGDGFFVVQSPEGPRYTRNGAFILDREGRLVTHEGYPVLGRGGPIELKGSEIIIDRSGSIKVDGREVDRIRIESFEDPTLLRKVGRGLFQPLERMQALEEAQATTVLQGAIELPNIGIMEEMVRMIQVVRTYEAQQKLIRSFDELSQKAVNELGRV